jgi:outer membrane protein assembly factor BamB
MHRTSSSVAIQHGLLIAVDFGGLVHCLDARTGQRHWTHDLLAATWSSPLISDGVVYLTDEDGDVTLLELSTTLNVLGESNLGNSIYATPIAADGVLYIATQSHLFALAKQP